MPVGRPLGKRVTAWLPFIEKFGLDKRTVMQHSEFYTLDFAEQIQRCADDDARALLLGVSK